jgi:NADPH2:quinone reductase
MKTKAVVINSIGSSDVLEIQEVDVDEPKEGEVRIRQHIIGVNFSDIYQRRGSHGPYGVSVFPAVIGGEAAGFVDAIGPGVVGFSLGQRVASLYPGAYQLSRNVPVQAVIAVPDAISLEIAGSSLVRGLTAAYLLRRLYSVKPGDVVLIHAAAGGMGLILSQWAHSLGAIVIGTVGSQHKMDLAFSNGCDHVINYRETDFASKVLEITNDKGVDVVYDAVGKDVFLDSLKCVKILGFVISYGAASGDVEAFDLQLLHSKSIILARPTLRSFITGPGDIQRGASVFFDAIQNNMVHPTVRQLYPFESVRKAHEDLEDGKTTGSVGLLSGRQE